MITQVEQLVRTLENREAGWVVRRDAAELLGKVAQLALSALTAHRSDTDMDVQLQVERSLEGLYAVALPGPIRKGEYTVRDLAMACEKAPARTIEPHDNGFVVTVRLNKERAQKVFIMPHDTRDGRRLVRIYTPCGEPSAEALSWALRANGKLTHGSFAIFQGKHGDQLVLVNSLLRTEANPENVKMSVKQIAYFGDWLEQHISGLDEF